MLDQARVRTEEFQSRLREFGVDTAIITDESSIAYLAGTGLTDISAVLGLMRMIKSPEEITIMRQAGEIAGAMMAAAGKSLAQGVPEYESALAVINAAIKPAIVPGVPLACLISKHQN